MDPHQDQLNSRGPPRSSDVRGGTAGASGNDQTPPNVDRNAPDSGNPAAADRQPRHSGGFTMIPPNESLRSNIIRKAQQEEEELRKWKETRRVAAVHHNPERLGGDTSLSAAREKQFRESRNSRLQKKLKQEEMDKKRRQEEEEELQKMKDEQRAKADRLEERKRLEEERRRAELGLDHLRSNESFLQRLESSFPAPHSSSSATHTSRRSAAVESQPREKGMKSAREVQLEHKRVNSAFLDRLEGRGRGSETETGAQEVERHLTPSGPDQSCAGWTEEAEPESEYNWALMKLMNSFPDCSKGFLEDILNQCTGDYEQAYTLLISTLS